MAGGLDSRRYYGIRDVRRRFFLFFEHFEDSSKNVPHIAFVTLASRLQFPNWGCCNKVVYFGQEHYRSVEYETQILRDTWSAARNAGWKVADVFDTDREKTGYYWQYLGQTGGYCNPSGGPR